MINKDTKIIHLLLGKANPDRMNGVNRVVYALASVQQNLGYNVEVWGITPSPNKQISKRNFKTRLFQSLKNKFKISSEIKKSISELSNNSVFHIHGGFIIEFYHISKVLKQENIPYVLMPHGTYDFNALKKGRFKKALYLKFIEYKLINNAKFVHLIGKSEEQAVNKLFPKAKTTLIPNGQNIPNEILQRNINSEKLIFNYTGRIKSWKKGLDLLVEGFAIYIKKLNGKAKLQLIGDGEDLSNLKKLASSLEIENNIDFLGSKYGEEKENIIRNSDAFFHTSRYEGMPMAILEAARMGVPCVVNDETNMLEYIEKYDAGFIIKKNTPDEIAQSMKQVEIAKNENKLLDLGQNAFLMAKQEFDWKKIVEKLYEIYQA